jgi:hypothetical protein
MRRIHQRTVQNTDRTREYRPLIDHLGIWHLRVFFFRDGYCGQCGRYFASFPDGPTHPPQRVFPYPERFLGRLRRVPQRV